MPEPSPHENQPEPTKASLPARLVGGLRGALHALVGNKLRAVILAVALVAVVTGLSAVWLVARSTHAEPPKVTLEMALTALDEESYPQAKAYAEAILGDSAFPPERRGGPAFVLGAAAAHEADAMGAQSRGSRYLVAARYLEEARDRGFPPGREAEGLYLLGRSLFYGGKIGASRSVLDAALAENPDKSAELLHLLSQACLRDVRPQLADALRYNEELLKINPLPAGERIEAQIESAQILFRQGKTAECASVLHELPSPADELADAVLLRAQLLMEEARALRAEAAADPNKASEAREKYQAAIKLLRVADSRDTLGGTAASEAMYLIGVCFVEMKDTRAALQQFDRTRRHYPNTQEAVASSLQEGDLYRLAGQDNEAIAAYHRVIETIKTPDDYVNRWMPIEAVRTRFTAAYDDYRLQAKYSECVILARMMATVEGPSKSYELEAESTSAWGHRLLADAESLPPSQAGPMRDEGLAKLRTAGLVFDRLARREIASRQYPDYLWTSATNFYQGQDYASAARMIREYLRNEVRRRHPEALVLLAESLMALARVDEAIKALEECIEFHPRDAATYRARYLASQACLEKNDAEKAEALLRDNLSGAYLSPASREWRESLFALGALLHSERRYNDAIVRLDEALQRYPEAPQSLEARYLLADSYRQRAQLEADKLKQDLPATSQLVHSKEIHDNLRRALEQYRQLQEIMTRRQEQGPLSDPQRAILRNVTFAVGSVLTDLGELEPAAKAYFAAANRYQHSPESLDAYLQIAGIYRRLGRPTEARRAIEQAKVVLSRLKPETDLTATTNFDRRQWSEVLDALSQL